jgi:PEP-CTERM motif
MFDVSSFRLARAARRSLVAAAAVVACAGASAALPQFTFDPAAVGLAGTAFTADNLLISDYATVTTTATGFSETGYLAITGAQLGSSTFIPTGLTSTYGLYIQFTGTGTNSFSSAGFNGGTFDTLSYTLYGYNGPASFSPTSAPAPLLTLASGSLDMTNPSTFSGTSSGGTVTSANANAYLTINVAPGGAGFFASPTTFYSLAQSAFNNTPSEITTTATGFVVTQGGGSINFIAAPVPEPGTYALMLAGLGVMGFVARRRKVV